MLELGPDAAALHASVGRAVAERGIDVLVTVGPLSADTAKAAVAAGVSETVGVADAAEAPERVRAIVRAGDTVLVKGSRGMRMERVVAALMEHT
jgi:UDP-N-acetylmuramyl pentapeptide synthase